MERYRRIWLNSPQYQTLTLFIQILPFFCEFFVYLCRIVLLDELFLGGFNDFQLMRRFLFWSLCFCLLFPVGLSSCDGSDSAAVIFGGTTGELTWTLTEDGVLTITGEGPMPDYRDGGTSETPPWYPHVNRISSLTIGEGVTRIGDYAFMLCSFVTEVVIPESVTSMGDWAFWHCQSLKRITFPDRMVRFGEWAFYENESLQSVCIPEGVTTIPSSAFARCHNLTCVIMPGSLQTICGGAFSQCHKLTDVTIPDGVTVIETGAFPSYLDMAVVTCLAVIPPELGKDNFGFPAKILYVPAGSVEVYRKNAVWREAFETIAALP